jgi:hypothetical protein
MSNPSPWLVSRRYDVLFFQVSALLSLALVLPYWLWASKVVQPLYVFYLLFFGLPHNYLTWATIFPATPRRSMNTSVVYSIAAAVFVACLAIPLTAGSPANDWVLSAAAYISFWHAYKQHDGICRVYDAVQIRRTGDKHLASDRRSSRVFLALGLHGVFAWAFTRSTIPFRFTNDERWMLIHPRVPDWFFQLYVAVTCAVGAYAAKRLIWDRLRRRAFVPVPQIGVIAAAIVSYAAPFFVVKMDDIPLSIAIGTMYHNIQYYGFVWMFERRRASQWARQGAPLQMPQRLAARGAWAGYFGMALVYSAIIGVLYQFLPRAAGLVLVYTVTVSHYLVDGFVWRRKHNRDVAPTFESIALAVN